MTENNYNKDENQARSGSDDSVPPPVPNPYRIETPFQREVPISTPKPKPYSQASYSQPAPTNQYAAPYKQAETGERPPNPYLFPYDTPPAPPATPPYTYQPSPAAQPTQRHPVRRIKGDETPIWTYGLLLAILGMFVVQMTRQGGVNDSLGLASGFSSRVLLDLGALNPQLVRQGEWWRLVSAMFLHGGVLHILFNGMALYSFGLQLEQLVGRWRFPIIYFLGGLGGSILSVTFGSYPVAVGASGAIFALLGAMIGFLLRHRDVFGQMGRSQLNSLVITAVLNFAITLSIPNIDNMAHFGGLAAGAFLGYFMQSEYTRQPAVGPRDPGTSARAAALVKEWWPVIALGAVEVALFVFFLNQPATPIYRGR